MVQVLSLRITTRLPGRRAAAVAVRAGHGQRCLSSSSSSSQPPPQQQQKPFYMPTLTEKRVGEGGRGGRASEAGVKVALFGASGFLGNYVTAQLGTCVQQCQLLYTCLDKIRVDFWLLCGAHTIFPFCADRFSGRKNTVISHDSL